MRPVIYSRAVVFRHVARHYFLATWDVNPDQVNPKLPEGFRLALVDGRALVSLAALRLSSGRIGRLSIPGWRQLYTRTYVTDRRGEPAVFIFSFRVTLLGLLELPFGVPVRSTLIGLSERSVTARGPGVLFTFALTGEPAELPPLEPPLGSHEVAYWRAAGLRRAVARHAPIRWQHVRLEGEVRFDPVLALGFDVPTPPVCAYADDVEFRLGRVEKVAPLCV